MALVCAYSSRLAGNHGRQSFYTPSHDSQLFYTLSHGSLLFIKIPSRYPALLRQHSKHLPTHSCACHAWRLQRSITNVTKDVAIL